MSCTWPDGAPPSQTRASSSACAPCAASRTSRELGKAARLSPERLRHLVVAQTGMPLSEHRLLQRATLAIELLMRGARLSEAALAAGFADHAHFTRTFGRLFGRTPSSVPARAALRAIWAERADAANP